MTSRADPQRICPYCRKHHESHQSRCRTAMYALRVWRCLKEAGHKGPHMYHAPRPRGSL